MKRPKPAKRFDCVKFKRQAQAEIYREIEGLSPEEEIEYFRRRVAAGPFGKLWKALESRSRDAKTHEPSPAEMLNR
ncbi:MAG TPA: hypothetical protein VGW37_12165 [Terriglobia bacterium]|nr:hypothetical protein [Terriglobia bacterium]HEV2247400.1 hypothetical protein [Terriglobia bacterium]